MSIYASYANYIDCFINTPISTWSFKSNPLYTVMLEHVTKDYGDQYLFEILGRYYNFNI